MLRSKACEQVDEGVRLLDLRNMTAGRQYLQARSFDQAMVGFAVRFGKNLVPVAPYDQRRHIDPMQPLAQLRIVKPRLPGEIRGPELVLDRDIALLLRDGLSEPLFGKPLVNEQIADALLLRPHEHVTLADAVDVDA